MTTSARKLLPLAATLALVAALAACSGSDDAGPAPTEAAEAGGWTFTDDRGETISLDEPPEVIAADASSAGGLWEYGIAVEGGVFGDITFADGSPHPAIGLADPDDLDAVGDTTAINLEQLASRRPQLIVAAMWSEDDFYGIDADQVDEVAQLAPIVGIRVDGRPVTEPLARIAELAESLDPDAADAVAQARAAFDESSDGLRTANEANPELLVVAASGSATEMYVAYPPIWPDLSYYQELGTNLVEPEDHPTSGGFWETLSWEEAGTYPADLVMVDARGGSLDDIRELIPATALSLPALAADQLVLWPAVHAYGYGDVAENLDALAAAVADADPTVGD